jgi:hypothetical protein
MALHTSDGHESEFKSLSPTSIPRDTTNLEAGPAEEKALSPNEENWDNNTDPSNPTN